MRVFRAIYRLDFLRNYEMINQPGTVARLIQDGVPAGFFDFYGEDRAARRIFVKRLMRDEVRFRGLTVEPTTIVCDVERAEGFSPAALAEDPDFAALCSVVSSILKHFEIRNFERVGLRLFLFGTNGPTRDAIVRAFKSLVREQLLSPVEEMLGAGNDVGIAFDGMSDAKVSYHLKVGPFIGSSEYPKYFSNIIELLSELSADTVVDLDLFESKFAYTAASAVKWCVPQAAVAAKVSRRLADIVTENAST